MPRLSSCLHPRCPRLPPRASVHQCQAQLWVILTLSSGLGGGEEEERFRGWFQADPLLLFWGETLSLEAWKGL